MPLIVALLLGTIVATTDPAAVIAIFRDVGAPPRLTRLLEGESLLNDAAAIVLFSMALEMLTGNAHPDWTHSLVHFFIAFLGGLLVGAIAGQLFGATLPLLRASRMAEVTLSVSLPYIVYLVGEFVIDVSGVVAVASAGLVGGARARVRLRPESWRYVERVWDQTGFWAGSLIFVIASALVPRLLRGMHPADLLLLPVVVVAALAARGAVLFGVLPVLSALRLSQRVSGAYKLAIAWGGLRGALTAANSSGRWRCCASARGKPMSSRWAMVARLNFRPPISTSSCNNTRAPRARSNKLPRRARTPRLPSPNPPPEINKPTALRGYRRGDRGRRISRATASTGSRARDRRRIRRGRR